MAELKDQPSLSSSRFETSKTGPGTSTFAKATNLSITNGGEFVRLSIGVRVNIDSPSAPLEAILELNVTLEYFQ